MMSASIYEGTPLESAAISAIPTLLFSSILSAREKILICLYAYVAQGCDTAH